MNNSLSAATVVQYKMVAPTALNIKNPQSIKDFRKEIILQTQGYPVIFRESIELVTLAFAFSISFKFATQAILQLNDRKEFILFDHGTQNLINTHNFERSVHNKIITLREDLQNSDELATPSLEESINLEYIWNEIKDDSNIENKTLDFLEKISLIIQPSINLKLIGLIPALPLLATIYLVYSTANKIQYSTNNSDFIYLT